MTRTDEGRVAIDLEAALAKVGGDESLLAELAELFCAEGPKLLATLREAVANHNAPAMRATAHSLKGSLGIFCARHAARAAARLEDCAETGQMAAAAASFAELEAEIARICSVLKELAKNGWRFQNVAGRETP